MESLAILETFRRINSHHVISQPGLKTIKHGFSYTHGNSPDNTTHDPSHTILFLLHFSDKQFHFPRYHRIRTTYHISLRFLQI